jgi:hypothetical protein
VPAQAIRKIWQQCAGSEGAAEESAKLTALRHSTLRKMRLADILNLVMEKYGEDRDVVRLEERMCFLGVLGPCRSEAGVGRFARTCELWSTSSSVRRGRLSLQARCFRS